MSELKYRQLHIDFHTGETFPQVAKDFSKEQFAKILKLGHINSVNMFAKCHHGCFYYKDSEFYVHPTLQQDLLPQMVEVCEELGIDYYIYISAGFDEYSSKQHPEWLFINSGGVPARPLDYAGYHLMCLNTPYLEYLKKQVHEVVSKFPRANGIFLDITDEHECYCESCKKDYERLGIDISDKKAVLEHCKTVYKKYYDAMEEVIHAVNPDMEIFHNMGAVPRSRRDLLFASTHAEIEALPNGHWGFDYFPLCCAYVRNLGMDFCAHTARFHTTWGDFGGYKCENALRYETAWHNAFGSKSIIGEQLHPYGKFDEYTYEVIGKAYERIEKLEEYSQNAVMEKEVAVFSQDYMIRLFTQTGDIGASKILLQNQYLYDLIDIEMDFSPYKVIIFPDDVEFDEPLYNKVKDYVAKGGKILVSGTSSLKNGNFAFDVGASYIGQNDNFPTFAEGVENWKSIRGVRAAMYEADSLISATGKVTTNKYLPYHKREVENFSSHLYNTYDENTKQAGGTAGKDGEYISWRVFSDFYKHGSIWAKEMVVGALGRLIPEKKIQTNLPSGALTTLFKQEKENRYVMHLLFAQPYKRGDNQVIEDIIPLHDISVSVAFDEKIIKCYDAISKEEIPFTVEKGRVKLHVDEIDCHKVIVFGY